MDSLPEEYQQIIKDATVEASKYTTEKGLEYQATVAEEALKAANVNVIKIDNTEFRQALSDAGFYDKFNDVIGQDVMDWIAAN